MTRTACGSSLAFGCGTRLTTNNHQVEIIEEPGVVVRGITTEFPYWPAEYPLVCTAYAVE